MERQSKIMVHHFPTFILASKSPRRHFLLKEAGFDFEVQTLDVDESFDAKLKKEEVPLFLAKKKAMTFESKDKIIVTADTVVSLQDEIINKPGGEGEAVEMLLKLSGQKHTVYSGVCIRKGESFHCFYEETEVFFKELTQEEIKHYVKNYQPFDKAGAYGIQDWIGYIGVSRINGCFYNVMGFPVSRFYQEFTKFLSMIQ